MLSAQEKKKAPTREEKVRNDRSKVEAEGYWIYNDLAKGFAEAEKSGKPMLVVLRCLPCEECVKLDDELLDNDKVLRPLLEQFVRVRVISTNGLDLSLFQFDTDQSFAIFMLNADRTIYGRYGTRSHRTIWDRDVSIEGLGKSLQGALDLHRDYPKNKAALIAKTGPKPEFASPELYPTLKNKYTSKLNYEGNVVRSCIHCHQIGDAQREVYLNRGEPMPERVLFPFPHPKSIGLIVDPREKSKIKQIAPGSASDQAGLKAGDEIIAIKGQPILSIADIQWILNGANPNGDQINVRVHRDGASREITLKLEKGWRHRDDISWRASSWELRRVALGGMLLRELETAERERMRLTVDQLGLRVGHVGEYSPHDIAKKAGIRTGDVLIGFDGITTKHRETDLLAHIMLKPNAKAPVRVQLLRDGKKMDVELPLRK